MSNSLANRNLLFGILAMQHNVIDHDALVAALTAWLAARGKGLAQILREQQAITENQHALLEECVDTHLARHGADAVQSLAAVCLLGPARDAVQALDDAELRAGLAHVSATPLPEPEPDVELIEPVEAVTQEPPKVQRSAPPATVAKSGIPGCAWLAAGLALGLLVAIVVLGGGVAAVLALLYLQPANAKQDDAIARVEPVVQAPVALKPQQPAKPALPVEPAPAPKKQVDDGPPRTAVVKPAPAPAPGGAKPSEPVADVPAAPPGFEPLFNGKDLTGWQQPALFRGDWHVEHGILSGVAGERNFGRLETDKPQPRDFHLRVEARVLGKGTALVTFRTQPGSRLGYETIMGGFLNGDIQVGNFTVQAPLSRGFGVSARPSIARGQWFVLDIIAQGNRFIIKVDGKTTSDLVDLTYPTAGHIALGQIAHEPVEFRRIDIKALPPAVVRPAKALAVTPGFTPLFNGKDLTGWRVHRFPPGNWRVEDGILIGSAPGAGGRLFTDRPQPANFHLRLEARIHDKACGGVLFRCPDGKLLGYEAPLNSTSPYFDKTGSLAAQIPGRRVNLFRLDKALAPPDQWVTLDIIAQDKRLIVKVDGKTTVEVVEHNHGLTGDRLVLAQYQSTIEFRKVEIKPLEPVAVLPPAAPPLPVADGFVPLFNGKDLTGWKSTRGQPRDWNVIDGILTGVGGRLNLLYTTRADYTDFHLRAEARINDDGFSSLLFRYNRTPAELDHGRLGGYGVRLAGRADDVSKTGSLMAYEKVGMRHLVVKEPLAAPGQWFNLEIIAQGHLVTTKVNGRVAISFRNPKTDLTAGRIVLEANSTNRRTVVEYRKLEIKELKPLAAAPPLPAPPPPRGKEGFTPLFNAKDLTGWQAHPKRPGNWRAENGLLIGSAPAGGSLYSTRGDYQDFHLRADVRINDQGFGRVFFRAAYDPARVPFKVLGYEALLNQRPVGDKLGTLRATNVRTSAAIRAAASETRAGDWFVLEVVAKGERVTVSVNGKPVADVTDSQGAFARRGHIVLHQDANAVLEFRRVEVRELSDAREGAAGPP